MRMFTSNVVLIEAVPVIVCRRKIIVRLIRTLLLACPLLFASLVNAADEPLNSGPANINLVVERAMACNMIAGGMAVVGNHDCILCVSAQRTVNGRADGSAMNERTIFDLASLTKVIATTPAVMKLLDEGR